MKDLIYIPHQDRWNEHFPNPGSNKKDYTLYLSDPQAQYNKLLRTQQKLRNKKISHNIPTPKHKQIYNINPILRYTIKPHTPNLNIQQISLYLILINIYNNTYN